MAINALDKAEGIIDNNNFTLPNQSIFVNDQLTIDNVYINGVNKPIPVSELEDFKLTTTNISENIIPATTSLNNIIVKDKPGLLLVTATAKGFNPTTFKLEVKKLGTLTPKANGLTKQDNGEYSLNVLLNEAPLSIELDKDVKLTTTDKITYDNKILNVTPSIDSNWISILRIASGDTKVTINIHGYEPLIINVLDNSKTA
ncbi:hypothetical protein [Mesoplasma lactucae]|uniref:Uncharacterized protein n=1 Tax=Mesoplasma lactucae ATCC 49193 TaxID=81460 RepID=A0A291IRB4_9MOLU|nr:hypothetical protein [Mesoplasma lactucae]ATG97300.1 hypothetical protein CP520_00810 [Mesoplasma lactucae ATCC 49193]ATZ20250.1 hypothetical protein MLACT_v1c04290 [Mesoplasma lactucae ATCC 49193]MCL8216421.1 hypothetical protein [Mesoplasma lactucae ATCC 49193]